MNMDRPRPVDREETTYRARLPKDAEPVVMVRKEKNEDNFGKQEHTDFPVCPRGTVMHRSDQVAAYRAVGGRDEPLCTECAKNRCDIRGKIVCQEHCTTVGDKHCCSTHGFWQVLRLGFRD
jgi:hypothetical protein